MRKMCCKFVLQERRSSSGVLTGYGKKERPPRSDGQFTLIISEYCLPGAPGICEHVSVPWPRELPTSCLRAGGLSVQLRAEAAAAVEDLEVARLLAAVQVCSGTPLNAEYLQHLTGVCCSPWFYEYDVVIW